MATIRAVDPVQVLDKVDKVVAARTPDLVTIPAEDRVAAVRTQDLDKVDRVAAVRTQDLDKVGKVAAVRTQDLVTILVVDRVVAIRSVALETIRAAIPAALGLAADRETAVAPATAAGSEMCNVTVNVAAAPRVLSAVHSRAERSIARLAE